MTLADIEGDGILHVVVDEPVGPVVVHVRRPEERELGLAEHRGERGRPEVELVVSNRHSIKLQQVHPTRDGVVGAILEEVGEGVALERVAGVQ